MRNTIIWMLEKALLGLCFGSAILFFLVLLTVALPDAPDIPSGVYLVIILMALLAMVLVRVLGWLTGSASASLRRGPRNVSSPSNTKGVGMLQASTSQWRMGLIVASGCSMLLLLGAVVERRPYGYYTLLRLVVCATALYLAFIAYEAKSVGWAIALALTGVLFNPILPVRMRRADWQPFDIVAAIVIAVATVWFGRTKSPDTGTR